MDKILYSTLNELSLLPIMLIFVISLVTLSKGADILVDEAVSLSLQWGIPKMIIGATIVSLGTTLPEATVSVFAALNGNPDLALGNAIGSIITDTGLILGVAALIGTLPIDRKTINHQGRLQLGSVILLAFLSLPFLSKGSDGVITQWMGILFIALLITYIFTTIKWAKEANDGIAMELEVGNSSVFFQIIKLVLGIILVILSSKVLIPSVEIAAIRVGIPQSIIAATLVAFGTSLPELVTAIASVRKGHGELAIGNIIGADILNVLFVVGSAAAVTKKGLLVPIHFYQLQIPTMLIVVIAFRIFAKNKNKSITKIEGLFLLGIYCTYLVLNYVLI
ncbi:calcium/sodium antiporter [Clostridium grantii]|uniref:Cation:H+ antiporter n=1 Tax=Clostridium grantii DSM 8605 TaxID=1121316 RepID=A0A1M5X096_9CLOT|nr:calcium/sodium antiporter [Clostridium grantii]SHH93150.1 cation:H+ antiporter [Clostridium grantii DSM 8605]